MMTCPATRYVPEVLLVGGDGAVFERWTPTTIAPGETLDLRIQLPRHPFSIRELRYLLPLAGDLLMRSFRVGRMEMLAVDRVPMSVCAVQVLRKAQLCELSSFTGRTNAMDGTIIMPNQHGILAVMNPHREPAAAWITVFGWSIEP